MLTRSRSPTLPRIQMDFIFVQKRRDADSYKLFTITNARLIDHDLVPSRCLSVVAKEDPFFAENIEEGSIDNCLLAE
jgi:hypothetical protein